MAQSIFLTSGSILNGSPITFAITPDSVSLQKDGTVIYPSFHRVILEVECGSGSLEVIKMSSPVLNENGGTINIDISSALRIFRDTHEYNPDDIAFPVVKFNVRAYDEYMLDGKNQKSERIYFPSDPNTYPQAAYLSTIFGRAADIERKYGFTTVQKLSRKPSSPQIVTVGETYMYAVPFSSPRRLEDSTSLESPKSVIENITKEGAQTIGGHSLYALPASEADNRTTFRFVNSYGVIESISVPRVYSKKVNITSNTFAVARQETYSHFSHAIIRKQNNVESWAFATDPLDEDWLYWFIHEFLMSEYVWIEINDKYVPCLIIPDEDIAAVDRTKSNQHQVLFTAQLDINGTPLL